MSRVQVAPELLRWARERSGWAIDELRKRFPKLDLWESKEVQPTLRQLEDYARATQTPFGYFFLSEPPELRLAVPQFRTIDDDRKRQPSPNLLETIQTMERRQAWLRETLIAEGEQPLEFVGSQTLGSPVDTVAQAIRTQLGFDTRWAQGQKSWKEALQYLRNAIDTIGIVIASNGVVGNNTHRKLDANEFRGFVLVDQYAPLIFVNSTDGRGAQMFTLAHELAHIWFGESAVFESALQPAPDRIERECNAVAAEFLVPSAEIKEAWPSLARLDHPFRALARRFKVSQIVAARRALDLGLMSRDEFFLFYREYQEELVEALRLRREEDDGGGNFYNTLNVRLGRRFALAVIHAAREGRLPYREAYSLTGLTAPTFERYAAELGMGRTA
jgi:Zn-dependent peptidase ImmA (M78 family)